MYLETDTQSLGAPDAFKNDRFLLDYPSYSLTGKIPTLSYTWGLKRCSFLAKPAPLIGHNPASVSRGSEREQALWQRSELSLLASIIERFHSRGQHLY